MEWTILIQIKPKRVKILFKDGSERILETKDAFDSMGFAIFQLTKRIEGFNMIGFNPADIADIYFDAEIIDD